MTPQAFSYGTLGNDGLIYIPPYGLQSGVDRMLIINPETFEVSSLSLDDNGTREKWTNGIAYEEKV